MNFKIEKFETRLGLVISAAATKLGERRFLEIESFEIESSAWSFSASFRARLLFPT